MNTQRRCWSPDQQQVENQFEYADAIEFILTNQQQPNNETCQTLTGKGFANNRS